MKYYNCKNREGFNIDGKMDDKELSFIDDFCPWSMVTGPSGTLLQSFDFEQNFAIGVDKGDVFKSWYYDNGKPLHVDGIPLHVDGAPVFSDPAYFSDKFQNATNGFHLCSALQDSQVSF